MKNANTTKKSVSKKTATTTRAKKTEIANKIAGKVIEKKFKGKTVEMFQVKDAEKQLLVEAVLTLTKTNAIKVYSHDAIKQFGEATMSQRAKEFRPYQYHVTKEKFDEVFSY